MARKLQLFGVLMILASALLVVQRLASGLLLPFQSGMLVGGMSASGGSDADFLSGFLLGFREGLFMAPSAITQQLSQLGLDVAVSGVVGVLSLLIGSVLENNNRLKRSLLDSD